MISIDAISARAEGIRRRYGEKDLFRLCGDLGIRVVLHETSLSVAAFKGLSMV